MYSQTCLNWSCSKAETLLRRTDTLDPVGFLYAFLSCISKAKNCKGDIASDRYYFQSSAPCLTRTQIKILGISEKQGIKLDIFVNFLKKKQFFLHFKATIFFWFQFAILKKCNTFDSNSRSFFPICSLQATSNCFCATESDIDLQNTLHPSMNYWFQYCDLH